MCVPKYAFDLGTYLSLPSPPRLFLPTTSIRPRLQTLDERFAHAANENRLASIDCSRGKSSQGQTIKFAKSPVRDGGSVLPKNLTRSKLDMTGTARIVSIVAGLLSSFLLSPQLLSLLLLFPSTFLKTSTTLRTPRQMIFSTAVVATLAASLVTAQASAVPKVERRWGSACQELWKTAPELLSNLEVYAAQNYPGQSHSLFYGRSVFLRRFLSF